MNGQLNGLTEKSPYPGLFPQSNNSKTENSTGMDFLNLLQNRMFFGFNDDTAANQSSKMSSLETRTMEKSWEKTGYKTLNLWEKPTIHNPSQKPEVEKPSEELQKDREKISDEKTAENATENEASARKAAIKQWLAENSELMPVDLSEDQKIALVETLAQLDSEKLQEIAKNPRVFVDQLLALLDKMPESAQNEQLVSVVKSEEFAGMIEQAAEAIIQINQVHQVTSPEETSEGLKRQDEALSVNTRKLHRNTSMDVKASEQQSATDSTENSESAKEEQVEKAVEPDKSAKKEAKKVAAEDSEKSPKIVSEAVTREGESLRESFRRMNQRSIGENAQSESASTAKPEATAESQIHSSFKFNAAPADARAAIPEELTRKLVNHLMGQPREASAKTGSFSAGSVTISSNKTSNFQNNTGNGFSNGFSSSNQSAQVYRQNQVNTNNNVFLAQLLEKAEMFKTVDGKKVLSLELDPRELGKMEMELTSRDGTVTAKISAESELAKSKLEELAPQIKEHLNTQGINLTEITVDISSRHPDERNNQQMSEGKNKSNRSGKIDAASDEQIIRKNILPNLRKIALKIQSVDLMV